MRSITLIMLLLPQLILGQQNLVLNGSFEENFQCPGVPTQWTVTHWQSGNGLTPDYYHVCGDSPPVMVPTNLRGHQYPNTGDAYVGIWAFSKQHPEARDYIQTTLSQPLYSGVRYAVSFRVTLAERYGGYSVSTIAAALTVAPPVEISNNGLLDVDPQVLSEPVEALNDTINWVLIADTIASRTGGGELYITIGNFHLDEESDTALFNPNAYLSDLSYYYIDDVSVVALDSIPNGIAEAEQLNFSVHPNPSSQFVEVNAYGPMRRLRLLDMRGREVVRRDVAGREHKLDLGGLPPGMYFLEVTDHEGRRGTERIIKTDGP